MFAKRKRFVPTITAQILQENEMLHTDFVEDGGSVFVDGGIGITLAVCPAGGDLFRVATAYCNPADAFSHDYGLNLVLGRFYDGNTITVKAVDEDAVYAAFYEMAIGAGE